MKKRYFIITVDTEGDNLWKKAMTPDGMRIISTENARYISRFHELCNKFGFLPTYLVNYEMATDEYFIKMGREWTESKSCEIGMHMHAWNSPPLYDLPFHYRGHNPYAGEYPRDIMKCKLEQLTEIIAESFRCNPKSHRGGRWYIDEWYINELIRLGYVVDCSITPGISWRKSIGNEMEGPDYSLYKTSDFFWDKGKKMLEVPPTIIKESRANRIRQIMDRPYDYKDILKKRIWLRPNGNNLNEMLWIVKKKTQSHTRYLEFMIHSSELMPGGSPTFRNPKDIEKLYQDLDILFGNICKTYEGITLTAYRELRI